MNVRIEGNCKKPTKQWPNNLYYECEFIAEHYLNTLVKFWNFSHRISRLRAIDCSSCDCVSRHDDCSRGWDFISGVWPFSNFFLNIGRERRWPRWIKKASHIGSKRLCITHITHCFLISFWYCNIQQRYPGSICEIFKWKTFRILRKIFVKSLVLHAKTENMVVPYNSSQKIGRCLGLWIIIIIFLYQQISRLNNLSTSK